jgi:hypothetical protein
VANPRISAMSLAGPHAASAPADRSPAPLLTPTDLHRTTLLCSPWQTVPRSPRGSDKRKRERSVLSGALSPRGTSGPLAAASPTPNLPPMHQIGQLTTEEERDT